VDAIQSLGVIPLDLQSLKLDFLAAGSHKWIMGLPGSGILYISKEANELIEPVELGWKSVKHEEEFYRIELDIKTEAQKLEAGTMNVLGILAMDAGIRFIESFGIRNVFKRVTELNMSVGKSLSNLGFKVISPIGNEYSSGILSFKHPDHLRLYNWLISHNIKVSIREDLIRISPHFYNNESDMDRLLICLQEYEKSR
jgi:selenocysteine lyase/cysteine desulfurase